MHPMETIAIPIRAVTEVEFVVRAAITAALTDDVLVNTKAAAIRQIRLLSLLVKIPCFIFQVLSLLFLTLWPKLRP
jgi:branched-subunit amino acid transport protein